MTDGGPITILLVEDDPAHVEDIRRAFDAAGLKGSVQVAGTLREYRDLVAADPPEIAIIDLNLPDGRALEVLSWPPEAGAFPMVVMTSHGNQEVAVEAMKAGALDYVVKSPEAFAGMPRTVERALREWGLLQERWRAEEALRLSHERFRLANRAAFNAIRGWDLQTDTLLWNETFHALFGYRAEEIEPGIESWTSRIHPRDLDRVTTGLRAAIDAGRQSRSGEYRFRRKDGAYAEIEDRGHIARDASGHPARMIGAMQDVTVSKRAERALTLHTRVAVIFASIPGDEMYNEVLKLVLDVMRSPFGVFGYIDEDGASVMPTMTRQVWDQCRIAGQTIRFPRATWGDGSWRRAIREKRTIHSNEPSTGVPEGHVGILRHISLPIMIQEDAIGLFQVANKETDYREEDVRTMQAIAGQVAPILQARLQRQRAEDALRENELRFRTLADSGQALIWTSGPDKKRDYFNQPWLAFTGRRLEQELGDGWAEGVHPDDLERCIGIYDGAFDRRERFNMDYRLRTHDGEYRWIQDNGTPRHDRQGNFLGYIGHCLDITGRKRAEKEIQSQLEELQRRHDVMLGREERVRELKREVNQICRRAGDEPRYPSQEAVLENSGDARPNSRPGCVHLSGGGYCGIWAW